MAESKAQAAVKAANALETLNGGDSAAQQGAIGSSSGPVHLSEQSAQLIKGDLHLSVTVAPAAGPVFLPRAPSRA